jgi:Fic family protein
MSMFRRHVDRLFGHVDRIDVSSHIPVPATTPEPHNRGWRPTQPYNALPPLPPAGEIETKAVLKRCVAARAALAALDQATSLIPDQGILLSAFPTLEAQASSEIENIVTTTAELFEHLSAEQRASPVIREALRYRAALLAGFRELESRPICTRLAEIVCSEIKGTVMAVRRTPGTALRSDRSGDVIYTPPEGEQALRDLLANWERFLNEPGELDPLVRMAIGHSQFEAIHPFTDGNGRTGRVLNSLFLVSQGLIRQPVLYLSREIIADKDRYYRLLHGVTTDGAWAPWVEFMLECVERTSTWTTDKVAAMRLLQQRTARFAQERCPSAYSHELVSLIFERPYLRIADIVEAGIAKRQTASIYAKAMVDAGILEERAAGQAKLFVNARLMRLLTHDSNVVPDFP